MVKIPYVPCYQVHIFLKERVKNCDPVEILILIPGTFRDQTYFTKYTSFFLPCEFVFSDSLLNIK